MLIGRTRVRAGFVQVRESMRGRPTARTTAAGQGQSAARGCVAWAKIGVFQQALQAVRFGGDGRGRAFSGNMVWPFAPPAGICQFETGESLLPVLRFG